ncbi:MAG: isoprenylcysteine carboxylmethyltransferase family protein [Chrysiogenales bacterium]|nr:MAG: isoprenylcysteine carboxylmethyltransferase family protein [Chrysiogenales bacterium]
MNKNIAKRVAQVFFSLVLQGVILFLCAWTIQWQWAWILLSFNIVILIVNFNVLPKEVIEERGRKKENVKKWDRILTSINIIPVVGIYAIAGLDYRYQWSLELNNAFHASSLIFYVLGSMLFTWAMVNNRYFSTMVRLQRERGHQVATSGPYRFVRHPGYLGLIVVTLSVSPALGSLYALIMSAISVILFVIRTKLEDTTLKAELDGYADYSKRVRYRLVPHVW